MQCKEPDGRNQKNHNLNRALIPFYFSPGSCTDLIIFHSEEKRRIKNNSEENQFSFYIFLAFQTSDLAKLASFSKP